MPSIAAATRDRRARERRRLAAGVGLMVVGAGLVALGAAGAVSMGSVRTGLVIGALAVVVGVAVLVLRAPLARRERSVAAVGLSASLLSTGLLWVAFPTTGLPAIGLLEVLVGSGYLLGHVLAFAAVLAGATMPTRDRTDRSRAVTWRRSGSDPNHRGTAADGGAEDDLSFPLEDD